MAKRQAKPRLGRPPLGADAATETIKLRVTAATREKYEAAATKRGQSLSEFLRSAADAAIAR